MLITVSEIAADGKIRQLPSRARVEQVLISPCRELAMVVDVSMADSIIDGSMELPLFKREKKRQLL